VIDFGTFRLIREDPDGKVEVSFRGDADLSQFLQHVEDFLRASGFHFDGQIGIEEEA